MKLVDNQVTEVCYRIHYRSDVVITGTAPFTTCLVRSGKRVNYNTKAFLCIVYDYKIFPVLNSYSVRKLNKISRIG
jgi:hypothetical protein